MIGRIGLSLVAALTLVACERENPTLMHVRSADRTPDEFAILPTRPLETPPNLAALPTPTPGGVNRTDPQPQAEAIAALGGDAARGARADGALVATVSRYGVAPTIREQLAAEDLEFRRKRDGRLLERLFNVNVYFKAYREQSLDQHAELERLRRAGVRTVAAPPDPETLN
ncbi:hypothetical protein JANAI62_14170 [Jannaschia pagri]|uniref:Beta-barrel assembly machine subunit BamF n=1 Tax=Jannaschia pagri TaxID=2829797 RepID=A0ABQ4NK57_9RHOB|nr:MULTISPECIES: DUF3035 domain-containing protein [unclassified Jannaschia]GIT90962.1 hypothetical protein JANAI61_14200 [Jannaschia sp. AI_61]GIT94794.1 hypothetical protein JANAI62_14170 [Jannaschia sp. AI_62]